MLNISGIQKNIILAPYTTYKIGGPADYFFIASNKKDLINVVMKARKNKIPYFVLGTGANILIGDKGFRGLVIKNEADAIDFDENIVTVESGATMAHLIEATKE